MDRVKAEEEKMDRALKELEKWNVDFPDQYKLIAKLYHDKKGFLLI